MLACFPCMRAPRHCFHTHTIRSLYIKCISCSRIKQNRPGNRSNQHVHKGRFRMSTFWIVPSQALHACACCAISFKANKLLNRERMTRWLTAWTVRRRCETAGPSRMFPEEIAAWSVCRALSQQVWCGVFSRKRPDCSDGMAERAPGRTPCEPPRHPGAPAATLEREAAAAPADPEMARVHTPLPPSLQSSGTIWWPHVRGTQGLRLRGAPGYRSPGDGRQALHGLVQRGQVRKCTTAMWRRAGARVGALMLSEHLSPSKGHRHRARCCMCRYGASPVSGLHRSRGGH